MIKAILPYKSLAKLLFITLLLSNFSALAQKTTIFIVRHAEKETVDSTDRDPQLSAAGLQRAADLAAKLKSESFAAIFTTPFKRTNQTAAPLALVNKLQATTYNPGGFKVITDLVMQQYKGKEVLIAGHSNTVIPIVNAFGAASPLTALTDDDYDLLFKVVIDADGKAIVSVSRYGKSHHTTELP